MYFGYFRNPQHKSPWRSLCNPRAHCFMSEIPEQNSVGQSCYFGYFRNPPYKSLMKPECRGVSMDRWLVVRRKIFFFDIHLFQYCCGLDYCEISLLNQKISPFIHAFQCRHKRKKHTSVKKGRKNQAID